MTIITKGGRQKRFESVIFTSRPSSISIFGDQTFPIPYTTKNYHFLTSSLSHGETSSPKRTWKIMHWDFYEKYCVYICVLNYAKVYVKQNIFHKKSKYMIFHVLCNLLEV